MPQPRIATLLVLLFGLLTACTNDVPAEVVDSASSSGTTGSIASTSGAPTRTATSSPGTGVADETSATGSSSDQGCCSAHPEAGCDDPSIASCVCEIEAECCAFEWSQVCVNLAETQCGGCEPGGTTEGTDSNGSGTGPGEACCDPLRMPGCAEDPMVEACVCAMDPYCCDTAWDATCVGIAEGACGVSCGGGMAGDCCTPSDAPGCTDMGIEACVCAIDDYCCTNEWDAICTAEAQYECMATCGLPPPGGDCCMPHDGPECDDVALTECVCMEDNACCLFPWSNDCVTTAVNVCGATCEGVFIPDPCCATNAMGGCATPRIESCVCAFDPFCCNDQWDDQCVEEAQVDCGADCYPPGTEDCCNPHMSTGCDLPEVQSCVCGQDPFCCNNEWDGQCVDVANNDCGGCMGGSGTGGGSTGGGSTGGGTGDCCMANGSAGCDDPVVEACVCGSLPSCCNVEWSLPCVDEATIACMAMCAP